MERYAKLTNKRLSEWKRRCKARRRVADSYNSDYDSQELEKRKRELFRSADNDDDMSQRDTIYNGDLEDYQGISHHRPRSFAGSDKDMDERIQHQIGDILCG